MKVERTGLIHNGAEDGYSGDYCYCPFCDKVLFIPDSLATIRPESSCEHFKHRETMQAVFADPECREPDAT